MSKFEIGEPEYRIFSVMDPLWVRQNKVTVVTNSKGEVYGLEGASGRYVSPNTADELLLDGLVNVHNHLHDKEDSLLTEVALKVKGKLLPGDLAH